MVTFNNFEMPIGQPLWILHFIIDGHAIRLTPQNIPMAETGNYKIIAKKAIISQINFKQSEENCCKIASIQFLIKHGGHTVVNYANDVDPCFFGKTRAEAINRYLEYKKTRAKDNT